MAPFVDEEYEVWGRSVGNDGSLLGPQRVLSQVGPPGDPEFTVDWPEVVFDRRSNTFLTVWSGSTSVESLEFEVHGQAITGVPGATDPLTAQQLSTMGPDGDISYTAHFANLAIDPSTGRALVVWWGDDDANGLSDNEFEVFGQLAAASVLFVEDFESGSTGYWSSVTP